MRAYFEYLDALRAGGLLTDRFAAPNHLRRKFGLTEGDACKLYGLWAATFNEADSIDTRLLKAGLYLDEGE